MQFMWQDLRLSCVRGGKGVESDFFMIIRHLVLRSRQGGGEDVGI